MSDQRLSRSLVRWCNQESQPPLRYGKQDWLKLQKWYGLCDSNDVRILRRKHTLELLLGYFNSNLVDNFIRKLILQVLRRACDIKGSANELISIGFLSWTSSLLCNKDTPRPFMYELMGLLQVLFRNVPEYKYPIML